MTAKLIGSNGRRDRAAAQRGRERNVEAVEELVSILDREAVVVERVLFRLKALEMLLVANEHRFFAHAADELDEALDLLDSWERRRTETAARLAAAFNIPADELNISALLPRVGEPLRGTLLASQVRLKALLDEMHIQAGLIRDFAVAGVARVRVALERAGSVRGARYGQDGIVPTLRPPLSIDERL